MNGHTDYRERDRARAAVGQKQPCGQEGRRPGRPQLAGIRPLRPVAPGDQAAAAPLGTSPARRPEPASPQPRDVSP